MAMLNNQRVYIILYSEKNQQEPGLLSIRVLFSGYTLHSWYEWYLITNKDIAKKITCFRETNICDMLCLLNLFICDINDVSTMFSPQTSRQGEARPRRWSQTSWKPRNLESEWNPSPRFYGTFTSFIGPWVQEIIIKYPKTMWNQDFQKDPSENRKSLKSSRNILNHWLDWLVVYLPLWKIWKSVGKDYPIYLWKIMFKTTNQIKYYKSIYVINHLQIWEIS